MVGGCPVARPPPLAPPYQRRGIIFTTGAEPKGREVFARNDRARPSIGCSIHPLPDDLLPGITPVILFA